jgi:hypothetical protein
MLEKNRPMASRDGSSSIPNYRKRRLLDLKPALILILAMVATCFLALIFGQLTLFKGGDSAGYAYFAGATWRENLSSVITLGYPAFLRVLAIFNPGFSWLPIMQLLIHFLAVYCFYRALIVFGAAAAASCCASVPLLFSALNNGFFPILGTDSLGQSLALATIAFCFLSVAKSRAWGPPFLVALCGLAAYQVRPVYLVLVVAAPCLALMLLLLQPRKQNGSASLLRLPAILAVLLVGPFLVFCALRWITVGHFGLVSFGGWNQISITSEMLTFDPIRQKLPERWNELSARILEARAEQKVEPAFQAGGIDYNRWRDNYVTNQEIALSSATQIYGKSPVLINRLLTQYSWDLIRSSPKPYLIFVVKNIFRGVFFETFNGQYVLLLELVFLISLFYGRQIVLRRAGRDSLSRSFPDPLPAHVRDGVALGAGMFLVMKISVVCILETPIRRYVHPAGMLIPAFLGLLVFREACLFAAASRAVRESGGEVVEPNA